MSPEQAREAAERDQLWAALRPLRPLIARLAAGESDGSEQERQVVRILARVVEAELDYRVRQGP